MSNFYHTLFKSNLHKYILSNHNHVKDCKFELHVLSSLVICHLFVISSSIEMKATAKGDDPIYLSETFLPFIFFQM